MYTTLIETAELASELAGGSPGASNGNGDRWAILDCRFDLSRPQWGASAYVDGHLPNALYAHLDRDLSGPLSPASGRHPLPTIARLAETFGRWGIDEDVQVVAYDQGNGAYAARLWWLLRWAGHPRVAVLNGGFAAWQLRPSSSASCPTARWRAGNRCWWTRVPRTVSTATMKRSTRWPVTFPGRTTIRSPATSTRKAGFCPRATCATAGRRPWADTLLSTRLRCAARA
jgi:hypothetical protein